MKYSNVARTNVLRPSSPKIRTPTTGEHYNCPQCSHGFASVKKLDFHVDRSHQHQGLNMVNKLTTNTNTTSHLSSWSTTAKQQSEDNLLCNAKENHFQTRNSKTMLKIFTCRARGEAFSSNSPSDVHTTLPQLPNTSSIHQMKSSFGLPPILFMKDVREIRNYVRSIISRSESIQQICASINHPSPKFHQAVQPFANNEAELMTLTYSLNALSNLSDVAQVRKTCSELSRMVEEHRLDLFYDLRLYNVFSRVNSDFETYNSMDDVQKRYLSKILYEYERNGACIEDDHVRMQILDKKKEISRLALQFNRNVIEDTSHLLFTEEELTGLSKDDLSKFNKSDVDGRFIVMSKPTDINAIEKYAILNHIRERAHKMIAQKCQDVNTTIFERVIQLRNQVAQLLGYANHAEYILKIRMAQTSDHVSQFLDALEERVKPLEKREYHELLKLKKQHCRITGQEFDGKVNSWDVQFLVQLQKNGAASVGSASEGISIREYFPFEDTMWKIFQLFGKLFSFSVKERTDEIADKLWHKDVRFFSMYDKQQGTLMGHFFIDSFPRPGKFQRSACFPLQTHCVIDNFEQAQVVCIVTNFRRSETTGESMLEHRELITFLHEFGHCMHNMCTKSAFARFAGTNVEKDFAEFPSQLIQTWAWNKDGLRYLSSHYLKGNPLPDDVIDTILMSRSYGIGIETMSRIHLSKFDLYMHSNCNSTSNDKDKDNNNNSSNDSYSAQVYRSIKSEMSLIQVPEGCNPSATFGHLMRNYDSTFYAYLYSQVFSIDVYNQFCENNSITQQSEFSSNYREKVLEMGGTKNGMDMLVNLLNRKPNNKAFISFIDMDPSAQSLE